ncbi:hypothetical protein BIV24_12370 [Streptomyces colonosanans]|uniref:Tryptophan synthase beta chain-like PALP domain-containing protein n=1 Tax=Streptomyces colonosanans TaxID=1428652 RepID=A0A1S2PHV9_9ACTN|nr:hypothetical protein BIV24_12370 [Streptomyces colonosanans]
MAPEAEVICIQPLGAPAMTHSWRQRRVVTTDSTNTIADGVAGRCPIPAVLDDLLLVADDAVLVQEASIIAGMRMLLDHAGHQVQPDRRGKQPERRGGLRLHLGRRVFEATGALRHGCDRGSRSAAGVARPPSPAAGHNGSTGVEGVSPRSSC